MFVSYVSPPLRWCQYSSQRKFWGEFLFNPWKKSLGNKPTKPGQVLTSGGRPWLSCPAMRKAKAAGSRWMVSRNPANSPVEVGSLSYYLQGFIYIPGGWEGDFWTIKSSFTQIFCQVSLKFTLAQSNRHSTRQEALKDPKGNSSSTWFMCYVDFSGSVGRIFLDHDVNLPTWKYFFHKSDFLFSKNFELPKLCGENLLRFQSDKASHLVQKMDGGGL